MARQPDPKASKVLDPIERVTEVIFGALMALTFTGSFSVASPGQEVRTMLWAALGCNLAWGLTFGLMLALCIVKVLYEPSQVFLYFQF